MAKEAKPEAATQAVNNLRSDARRCAIEAERLLRHYAKLDKGNTAYKLHIDPGDAFVLRAAGFDPDNPIEMRRQFGRIENETELAAKAGTPEDYQAARLEADNLAKEASRLSKELTPKIQALQRELQEADTASRLAIGKRDAMAEARQQLRNCLPPFTRQFVEYEKQRARLAMEGKQRCEQEAKCQKIVDEFVEAATIGADWVAQLQLVGD